MGKKKHKLRKHLQEPVDCYSSCDDDTPMDFSGNGCKHLTKAVNLQKVRKVLRDDLKFGKCQSCLEAKEDLKDDDSDVTVWLCLQCGNLGCGRSSPGQHALLHYQTPRSDSHAVCLNVASWSVWCYDCDEDVLPDTNKKLLECVEFLKKHFKPNSPSSPAVENYLVPEEIETTAESTKENATEDIKGDFNSETAQNKQERKKSVDILPKVKGLSNLGNTCFFNAVMQSLSQTHILSQRLDLQCVKGSTLTIGTNETELRSKDCDLEPLTITLPEGGPLIQSLASFLKEMQSLGRSRTVNPGHLFGQVCKKAPQFRGMMQQDSHELLRHLLDGVKSDETKRYQTGILKAFGLSERVNPKTVEESVKPKLKAYGRLLKQTVVDSIFSGQLISTVLCEECKSSSQVFEPFLDLSLPVNEEKPVRPNVSKKSVSDDVACFGQGSQKPSKYQEKKTKKQAKREAKIQRNKSKHSQMITITYGVEEEGEIADVLPQNTIEEHAAVNECDSTTNSVEKNASEISDADIEDNAESESVSSVTNPSATALTIVDGKTLEDDDWSLDGNKETEMCDRVGIEDLCLKVKGVHIRHDSLPTANGIIASDDSGDATYGDLAQRESCNGMVNGDAEKDRETDEGMWSDDGGENGRRKQHSNAKQEWMTKSLKTLAPRYQPSSLECSIHSCLAQFTAQELLTGNNKFGCEKCTRLNDDKTEASSSDSKMGSTVYTNASKQLLVFSPPAILTLHLKRFQQVGFYLRKVNRHVDFPLTLDLAPYCSSICLGLPTLKKCQKQVLYSLYAVVEHSGRLTSGHYTAYIKVRPHRDTVKDFLLNDGLSGQCDINRLMEEVHEKLNGGIHDAGNSGEANETVDVESEVTAGTWYHVSDSHVSESSEASVLKCQAYLLFYERVL